MAQPPWWQTFVDAIERLPPEQHVARLAKLAVMAAERKEKNAAQDIALRAWRRHVELGGALEPELRQALRRVVPGYHLHISTDVERIAAWQAAFAAVIRPNMLALEIGTGSGVLAMLAARAGAEIVGCESDPVMAAIGQAAVAHNGLADRVRIVAKPCEALRIPEDLARPADVLLLDLFSDNLFAFAPFTAIRSVQHLLRAAVITVPAKVSLQAALVDFGRWRQIVPGRVETIDLAPLRAVASMTTSLDRADPDIALRSDTEAVVSATLPNELPPATGAADRTFRCTGGRVNGILLWLRLELVPGHVLEARPGGAHRGAYGFYARCRFYALPEEVETAPGEEFPVRVRWDKKSLFVEPQARAVPC